MVSLRLIFIDHMFLPFKSEFSIEAVFISLCTCKCNVGKGSSSTFLLATSSPQPFHCMIKTVIRLKKIMLCPQQNLKWEPRVSVLFQMQCCGFPNPVSLSLSQLSFYIYISFIFFFSLPPIACYISVQLHDSVLSCHLIRKQNPFILCFRSKAPLQITLSELLECLST